MTDADLARWEAAAREDIAIGSAPYGPVPPETVLALIAEVRRLRADRADMVVVGLERDDD
jgi:hypothetical protein